MDGGLVIARTGHSMTSPSRRRSGVEIAETARARFTRRKCGDCWRQVRRKVPVQEWVDDLIGNAKGTDEFDDLADDDDVADHRARAREMIDQVPRPYGADRDQQHR
jgi:hypothetical protein